MHVPDGLMDPLVGAIGWAEFAVVLAVAVFLFRKLVAEKDLPRIAVLSAGIFVAQMLNFPVGGGTTGHLIGGALFAIIAGPITAVIGMTVILLIQALVFGDGGLTAFGLNALNMAVIAPLAGWGVFNILRPLAGGAREECRADADPKELVLVGVAAWTSVFLAASACAVELALSYAVSSGAYGIASTVSLPAMISYHAVIGVGEGVITIGVVSYLWKVSPGAFSRPVQEKARTGLERALHGRTGQAAVAILIVFALSLPLYFVYSSEGEDGLERTMSDAGVSEGEPILSAPLDYGEDYIATLLAGMLGFLMTSSLALLLFKTLRSTRAPG